MYSYTHGGDIYSLGKDVLDFSANTNPFGLPQGVKEAMIQAVDGCDIYPDPYCRGLKEAISMWEGIASEYIFCSNGAADIIYRIAGLKPKKALLAVPSFTEYEEALKSVDCEIEYYYMRKEKGFQLDNSFIEKLSPAIDMIFLCSPNNPTGHVIERELLEKIISICEQNGTNIVVDECFVDFLENSQNYTVKGFIQKYKNLIVLKAFTKLFSMAGVRLGYCFTSNEKIMKQLYLSGQPWAVSYLAQQAGIAATREPEYVKKSVKNICSERERLKDALIKIGYHVYDSKANFIFFQTNEDLDLKESLLYDKILIRNCENYRGLTKGYYRIAVKSPHENDRLINSLMKRNEIKNG